MSGWTYAKSGVNIDQKSEAIKALVDEVSYKRSGIGQAVRLPGLFASLVDFGDRYITMATDGVGSKLLIAEALNKWDTVGIDCIAMNVNDTICVNAEPTSFVDYIAIDEPKPEITFEDFGKMQFQVGEIIACEAVPKSKKLLCSQVKVGSQVKQIVSGIKAHYTPEEMVGKKVMVLTNLKPAKLAGVVSEGMLLCAEDADGNLALVTPEREMPAGAEIC